MLTLRRGAAAGAGTPRRPPLRRRAAPLFSEFSVVKICVQPTLRPAAPACLGSRRCAAPRLCVVAPFLLAAPQRARRRA